jgi:hypothetical protein
METEIIDNLKDKITPEIIKKILDENKSKSIKINVDHEINGTNIV